MQPYVQIHCNIVLVKICAAILQLTNNCAITNSLRTKEALQMDYP
jgi:hypothetical protein